MSAQHAAQRMQSKIATIATLEQHLDWFKRQLCGKQCGRFAAEPDPRRMHLGHSLGHCLVDLVPQHKRRAGLSVLFDGPEVAIDTNHI